MSEAQAGTRQTPDDDLAAIERMATARTRILTEVRKAIYGDSIWLYDIAEIVAEENANHEYVDTATFRMVPAAASNCDELLASLGD